MSDGNGPRLDLAGDFGGFGGRAWLNCAHQGPLPRVAVRAAERALAQKAAPHRIGDEAFAEVPRRLKGALGRLAGVPADQVILDNSTTYGLHLLTQEVPWRAGAAELRPETRLFCGSWVFSFSGQAADLDALGRVCRRRGVTFVNGSQAVGAARDDVFGTANFLNFMPWTASVEYLLEIGVDRVAAWDQALVGRLVQGLDPGRFRLLSPRGGAPRSTLVVLTHHQQALNAALHQELAAAGVDVALRDGNLRVSPHLYNTEADVDRALEVLDAAPARTTR